MTTAYGPPSALGVILTQYHVISALILRDIAERIGNGRIGIFFIFAEPLVLGAVVTAINSVLHRGEFAEIMMFYSVGYLCFYMLRNILNRASVVIHGAQVLLYHAHVTLLASFIARHIVELLICVAVMMVFVAGAVFMGARIPDSPLKILAAFVFIMLLTQGLAFLLASLVHEYPSIERGAHMVSYIFLPLSGIFFVIDTLPPAFQAFLVWFPWALAVDLLHDGMMGDRFNYHWDIPYILLWIAVLHLLGLAALRRVRETMEVE